MLGSILIYAAVSGLVDVKRVKKLASSDQKGLAKLVFFGLMMALGRARGSSRRVDVYARAGRLIFRSLGNTLIAVRASPRARARRVPRGEPS